MGAVKGDIHIIGKSLCCAMLRGAGYIVIDLGCDVTPDDFIDEAMVNHASIIGASSLMTTTLISQKDLVREVKSSGCRCRTIVGGAPCSQEWCDRIGARLLRNRFRNGLHRRQDGHGVVIGTMCGRTASNG